MRHIIYCGICKKTFCIPLHAVSFREGLYMMYDVINMESLVSSLIFRACEAEKSCSDFPVEHKKEVDSSDLAIV